MQKIEAAVQEASQGNTSTPPKEKETLKLMLAALQNQQKQINTFMQNT
jgi:hypothetical protein